MAGLSAAWQLERSKFRGVELFELEQQTGGNSRYTQYPETNAPWGAHYLPVPTRESRAVRALLEDMDLLSAKGFDERHLCHPQRERLWYGEKWHDGLVPMKALGNVERLQLESFRTEIQEWQNYRDDKGHKAFAVPLAASSNHPELRRLDSISFAKYAESRAWNTPFIQWLLEYATRDDYGAGLDQVSAWAGLHYFACRDGGEFRDSDAVFVWPEGNGKLTDFMRSSVSYPIHTRQLVLRVRPGDIVEIDILNLDTDKLARIRAEKCLYCLPSFQRSHHFESEPRFAGQHAPWVTANLVLKQSPRELTKYSEPAWDNVLYGSRSLGYVVATHQSKAMSNRGQVVWTWYRSFPNEKPSEVRKKLLASNWDFWRDQILEDLSEAHPNIREVTRQIDVALFGHGMLTPTVGMIFGEELERARRPKKNVWFAHADLSGMSIFEEAQYRGVLAAEQLMSNCGQSFSSLL